MTWKRLWLISAVMTILLGAFHSAGTEMLKKTAGKAEEETFQEGQEENRPLAGVAVDDGPSAEYTPRLLDGLKERNIKASFFLLGRNIPGNEEIVERMQEEGHLIGNHTYNHVQLSAISEAEAREEILKTNNIIYEITGNYPQYMRPPFGSWKKNLELCVEMIPVFWNIDTMDWKSQDVSSILNIVFAEAEDGAIILMHDEYETSVEAALQIADHLMKEGYEFVTADRLIVP